MSEHQHRGSWAVWLNDSDREPEGWTRLDVRPSNAAHVNEQDAEWLRQVIRDARYRPTTELLQERNDAEATVRRVREFVDGFTERGGGLVNTTDELWILALRKVLDGEP